MADSKKYDGSTWEHSLRKLTTATEAVENPLYSDGTAITSYTIKGNTVQNGTPTPSNPVDVNGVGVRTENLFDKTITDGIIPQMYINQSGQQVSSQNYYISYPLKVEENAVYTWNFYSGLGVTHTAPTVAFYDNNDNQIGAATHNKSIFHFTFTTPNNCAYIRASVYVGGASNSSMLLEGGVSIQDQIAIPFIPYGYKIPILSGDVTTNIYLGSRSSTRQIRKLVLDGTESTWQDYNGLNLFRVPDASRDYRSQVDGAICDSLPLVVRSALTTNTFCWSTGTIGEFIININNYNLADLKTYLNSNPITIWYVLATPETATVNEPLMKIGTYADTLSNATAIPTTEGANSITVDTTVQPSEFTATWTGWHNANVKEWDGSQWNE